MRRWRHPEAHRARPLRSLRDGWHARWPCRTRTADCLRAHREPSGGEGWRMPPPTDLRRAVRPPSRSAHPPKLQPVASPERRPAHEPVPRDNQQDGQQGSKQRRSEAHANALVNCPHQLQTFRAFGTRFFPTEIEFSSLECPQTRQQSNQLSVPPGSSARGQCILLDIAPNGSFVRHPATPGGASILFSSMMQSIFCRPSCFAGLVVTLGQPLSIAASVQTSGAFSKTGSATFPAINRLGRTDSATGKSVSLVSSPPVECGTNATVIVVVTVRSESGEGGSTGNEGRGSTVRIAFGSGVIVFIGAENRLDACIAEPGA